MIIVNIIKLAEKFKTDWIKKIIKMNYLKNCVKEK